MAVTFGNIRLDDAKNKCRVFVFSIEMNGGNFRPCLMLFSSHHHLEILVARSGHQNVTFFKVWWPDINF